MKVMEYTFSVPKTKITWFWETNDEQSKMFSWKGSLCSQHWSPDALTAMGLEGSSLYQLLSVTCAWVGAAATGLHVHKWIDPCVCLGENSMFCPWVWWAGAAGTTMKPLREVLAALCSSSLIRCFPFQPSVIGVALRMGLFWWQSGIHAVIRGQDFPLD